MLNGILENKNLLTVDEAAVIFKVKTSTLKSWIRKKYLPNNLILKFGSFVAFRKSHLYEFTKGELLTITELAKIFKMNERTLRSWIKRKYFQSNLVLKIGGIIRIKQTLLDKFINGEL